MKRSDEHRTRRRFSPVPRRFISKLFFALLISGLIQVILLGSFILLFSNRLIRDNFREQSELRIESLAQAVQMLVVDYQETALRLSKDPLVQEALFAASPPSKETLSEFYRTIYRALSGKIYQASMHLVTSSGSRVYSTHMVPSIYNPNAPDEYLSTFLRVKSYRDSFLLIDSYTNPKGDRIALSLFREAVPAVQDLPGNHDTAYIITDLNKNYLAEELAALNTDLFDDLYLLDTVNLKYVSLFREGDDGNFAGLPWHFQDMESSLKKSPGTHILIANGNIIAYKELFPDELVLAGSIHLDSITSNLAVMTRMLLLISLAGLGLSSLLIVVLARNINHPVSRLVEGMKQVEQGDLSTRIEEFRNDEFAVLFHGFNDMASQIQALLDARVEREKALRTAERKALQAQIDPHFLYNTLNTIKAMAKLRGVDEISTAVTHLGRLLREAIDSDHEYTTIQESLSLVEAYLQIQQMRFGRLFTWKVSIPESLRTKAVPRLILQPIVENAIVHGLEPMLGRDQRIIIIAADPENTEAAGALSIDVYDNGVGMSEEAWDTALKGRTGVGIRNVHQRLGLYFGSGAGLSHRTADALPAALAADLIAQDPSLNSVLSNQTAGSWTCVTIHLGDPVSGEESPQ